MKKVIYFTTVALLALSVNSASAQFDFDKASNFYLIWLDGDTELDWEITPRIVEDYRVNDIDFWLDIWSDTYSINEAEGKGYFEQTGGYLNCSANVVDGYQWAGGGIRMDIASPVNADLTKITGEYRFHMAIRKTNSDACRINLFGGGIAEAQGTDPAGTADDNQRAQFIVGKGDHVYDDPVIPNLTPGFKVNEWQVIDIPVSDLIDMGWNNRNVITNAYCFSYEFGNSYPNNLQFDGVFYYYPSIDGPPAGINEVQAGNKLDVVVTNKTVSILNATAPIEVYNVAGVKVKTCEQPIFGTDEVNKGIYIIKSGNAVAKVIIK